MATQRKMRRSSITDVAMDALLGVEHRVERALTVAWDELQAWQKDNAYILRGYRPASASYKRSIRSLLYFHNESVNIYSHLLGAIFFLLLSAYLHAVLAPRYVTATSSDLLAFASFFISAATCLGLSATFHTISNHSHSVASFGNQLDYLGIVVLIVGSFLPSLHYGFYCHPHLRSSYWIMMFILGSVTAIVTLLPTFRTPKWRPFRAGMFVALGLSGCIPILHGATIYGLVGLDERMGLRWVVAEGAMYIFGAAVYAARVPEKWYPGTFDLVGSSHQIFHLFVVAAAGAHLKSLCVAFDYLHGKSGGGC